MKLWIAIPGLLLVSVLAFAEPKPCGSKSPWPKSHAPLTIEEFSAHLEKIFRDMFDNLATSEEEHLEGALSGTTPPSKPGPHFTLQSYLRALNIDLQRTFLKEVEEIERTPDLQEKRRRAYDAWYENRIAASALAVFLRTVKYDRDFRTLMYAAHGEATRDLATHLMFLAWLQKLINEAKEAVAKGTTIPKPHPLHTLDLAQLKVRIDWVSQVLLEQVAHKYGWIVKVGATDYTQELSRYLAIQVRHQVAMDRLWRVLQETTWFHDRWLFRTATSVDVMRNRYANATFATKVFLPSVVVMGTAIAVFGDWAGLKSFLKRLIEAFLSL